MLRYLLSLGFLVFFACSTGAPQPMNPEKVARKWQESMDKNQFDQARALSTENAKEIVNMIERLIEVDQGEEDWLVETVFKEMTCQENKDNAICRCLIEEDGEVFQDSFILVKVEGKWLVDIAEEDLKEGPGIEQMIKELEGIMDEALEQDTLDM